MSSAPPPSTPARGWITRGVIGIILATFFSDVGHEMVTAMLPLYLASIGLGAAALGVMEGVADLSTMAVKSGERFTRASVARDPEAVTLRLAADPPVFAGETGRFM